MPESLGARKGKDNLRRDFDNVVHTGWSNPVPIARGHDIIAWPISCFARAYVVRTIGEDIHQLYAEIPACYVRNGYDHRLGAQIEYGRSIVSVVIGSGYRKVLRVGQLGPAHECVCGIGGVMQKGAHGFVVLHGGKSVYIRVVSQFVQALLRGAVGIVVVRNYEN